MRTRKIISDTAAVLAIYGPLLLTCISINARGKLAADMTFFSLIAIICAINCHVNDVITKNIIYGIMPIFFSVTAFLLMGHIVMLPIAENPEGPSETALAFGTFVADVALGMILSLVCGYTIVAALLATLIYNTKRRKNNEQVRDSGAEETV